MRGMDVAVIEWVTVDYDVDLWAVLPMAVIAIGVLAWFVARGRGKGR
ncbi:hypothetical protein [Lacipirellula sp.]